MPISLTVDLRTPNGGFFGTDDGGVPGGALVTLRYDRDVRDADGTVPAPAQGSVVVSGTTDPVVSVPFANDDAAVSDDSQGFAIIIGARWRQGTQVVSWSKTVAIDSSYGSAVSLSGLPTAAPVPPQFMTVSGALAAANQAVSDASAAESSAASSASAAAASAALVGAPAGDAVITAADLALRASSTAATCRATSDGVGINILSTTRWRMHAQVTPNQVWSQDLALVPAGSYTGPVQPPFLLDAATLAVTTPAPPNTVATPTWAPVGDSSIVITGTSFQWLNNNPQAASYGGGYRWTDTAGEYVTYTSNVAQAVAVYARGPASSNGGYGLVAIDGDTTKATSLPTAQAEVDAGRLGSAALVANGGTLNPTDRVINFYSSTTQWDMQWEMSKTLAAGSHTVKISRTGYKPGASTASRVYIAGFGCAPYATVGTPTTTTRTLFPQGIAYSAYEYAIDVFSADGSAHGFVGNVHGYDQQTAVAVYVDGAVIDTTVAGDHTGSDVTIIRDSTITSPNLTGTVATARVMYRLTRDGLEVRTRLTFAQACTLNSGYTAMYPVDESLNTGVIVGLAGTIDLTAGTGGAAQGKRLRSPAAFAYNPTTGVTCCMWLPDLSGVGKWGNSSTVQGGMFIEDRAGNVINKMYATLVSTDSPLSVAAGQIITGRTVYRAMQLPDPGMLIPAGA